MGVRHLRLTGLVELWSISYIYVANPHDLFRYQFKALSYLRLVHLAFTSHSPFRLSYTLSFSLQPVLGF